MKGKGKGNNKQPSSGDVATNAARIKEAFEGEFLCSTCERDDVQTEASNFCMDCNANLCPTCVAQHRKFPTMRTHKILGKSARRHLDKDVEEEENLLDCGNHPGKMVDMYCTEHGEVWCGGCMASYHRACSNVVFISDVSKNVLKSKELKEIKAEVKKAIKDFNALAVKVDKNMDSLATQNDGVLATIRDLRGRVNELLDTLEYVALTQLKDVYTRNAVKIGEDRLRTEAVLKAMGQLNRELEKPLSPTNTEADTFVYLQRAKKRLTDVARYKAQIQRGTLGKRLNFVVEPAIEEWMHKMRDCHLGHFIYKYRMNDVNVKLEDDEETCIINGASVMTDERILMTDWANKRLKLLDKFYSVVDVIDMTSGPNDVCHISTNEAMVSLPDEKSIQVVKIDPKLNLGKKYEVGTECRGMEFWAGELFVICGGLEHDAPGHLRVYNTSGKVIRAIEHDHLNKGIFSIPMRITISNDGTHLYVTDGEKGLITLKTSGEVLPTFEDPQLKWPWGICVDNNDQLFVCGSSSNNVVQIRDNAKIGVALTSEDGLKDPMSISFSPAGSRLIITTNKSDLIKVFTPM